MILRLCSKPQTLTACALLLILCAASAPAQVSTELEEFKNATKAWRITYAAPIDLAVSPGSEAERARQEEVKRERQVQAAERAEAAAGVGQTDGDEHAAHERDADGRRPWELVQPQQPPDPLDAPEPAPGTPRSRDASGLSGQQLDLTG